MILALDWFEFPLDLAVEWLLAEATFDGVLEWSLLVGGFVLDAGAVVI